jgi:hypothetical protein
MFAGNGRVNQRVLKVTEMGGEKIYKVKLSVCTKAYGAVVVYLHASLNLALGDGRWSTSHRGHYTPGKIVPGTHGKEHPVRTENITRYARKIAPGTHGKEHPIPIE